MTDDERRAFIRANTEILPVPLTPEIRLHLAHESVPLWQKTEDELGAIGLPPPFWAFAWAGGQALARHVLDHPEIVHGRRVVDLASGSGLVAIAALKAGAASVLAADIDAFAVAAIDLNASINSIMSPSRPSGTLPHTFGTGEGMNNGLHVCSDNLLSTLPPPCDVILVGDLFYEKHLAAQVFDWLSEAQQCGIHCLIGDPGRSYLPKEKLIRLADYQVPVTRDLEDAEIKKTAVWRLFH